MMLQVDFCTFDLFSRLIELRKRHAKGELPSLSSEQIIGQAIIFIFIILRIINLIIIG